MAKPGVKAKYTPEEIMRAVRTAGSQLEAARQLGISQSRVSDSLRKSGKPETLQPDSKPINASKWTESGNEALAERVVSKPIKTLADLYRVCEVDCETWECERYECTAWTTAMKIKTGEDEAPDLVQNYRVWARFKRRVEYIAQKALAAVLLADFRGVLKEPKRARVVTKKAGNLLLVNLPDIHFNKLCWEAETGNTYDLDTARSLADQAIDYLIKRAEFEAIDRIIFPIGNDLCHVDGASNATAGGTAQDVAGPWQAMFRATSAWCRSAIARLSAVAPVTVPVVMDNHGPTMGFCIGELLAAVYEGNKHITIRSTVKSRLYERFGRVLLGFAHYDKVNKPDALASLMAEEAKEHWAATNWREFHGGHLHKRQATIYRPYQEIKGVLVRISPSLAPPDRWHDLMGYVQSMRGGEAFVYSAEYGMTSSFHANVVPAK